LTEGLKSEKNVQFGKLKSDKFIFGNVGLQTCEPGDSRKFDGWYVVSRPHFKKMTKYEERWKMDYGGCVNKMCKGWKTKLQTYIHADPRLFLPPLCITWKLTKFWKFFDKIEKRK